MNYGCNQPPIRFRAVLELVEVLESGNVKYRLTHWGGSKEYMTILHTNSRGRKDKETGRKEIHIILKKNYQGNDPSTELNFELKNGLNLTGVKNWLEYGKLSGFAYGEPFPKETFTRGGKKKPNYLFKYMEDGFIFMMQPNAKDPKDHIPTKIEWIVLQGQGMRGLVSGYIPQFKNGGFNDALEAMPVRKYVDEDFNEKEDWGLFQNTNKNV